MQEKREINHAGDKSLLCNESSLKRNRINEIESQLEVLKVELISLRSHVSSESRKRQKLEEIVSNIFEGDKEENDDKLEPKLYTKTSPWNEEDDEWMEYYEELTSVEDANDLVVDRPRSQMSQWVASQFQRHKNEEMEDYQAELFEDIGVDWKRRIFRTSSSDSNSSSGSHQHVSRGRPKGSISAVSLTIHHPEAEINFPGQEHYNQLVEIVSKNHTAWSWIWFKWAVLNDDVMRVILEAPSSKEELKVYLSQIPTSKFPPWARGQTEARDKFLEDIYFWYRQVFIELKGIQLKKAELANGQSGDGAVHLFETSGSSQNSEIWGVLLPLPAEQFAFLRSIEQLHPSYERLVVLYRTEKETGMIVGPLTLLENDPKSSNSITLPSPFPSHRNRKFFGREIVKLEREEKVRKGNTISVAFPSWIEI